MEQQELTSRGRLGAMLITAAVALPILAVIAILITRHFLWVHYPPHTMLLWLLLDAVILATGLVLRENASVAASQHPPRKRNTRRMR